MVPDIFSSTMVFLRIFRLHMSYSRLSTLSLSEPFPAMVDVLRGLLGTIRSRGGGFCRPPPVVSLMPGESIFWVAFESFLCFFAHGGISSTCRQNRTTREYKFLTRNVFPCLVLPTGPTVLPCCHCDLMMPHLTLLFAHFLMTLFLLFFHVDVSPVLPPLSFLGLRDHSHIL